MTENSGAKIRLAFPDGEAHPFFEEEPSDEVRLCMAPTNCRRTNVRGRYLFKNEPTIEEGDGRDMYYVIWTLTGKENIVRDEILAQIGAEYNNRIHILTRERKQKYRGEWQKRKEKLFPGYLFMDLDATQVEPVREVLRRATEHAKVLKTGDELYPIHVQEEQLLRRLTGDTTNVEVSVGVIEGDKIVVREGPLVGMEGMIKRIDRHKRMAVLEVELFNRISEVKVGLEIVEKVERE